MVILLLSYGALVVGVFIPPAASAVGTVLEQLAALALWIVEHLDALPGSSFSLPRVSLAWTIAAALLAIAWLLRGRLRDAPMWIAAGVVVFWLSLETWSRTHLPPSQALRIDAIAVGDGTCMLIRAGGDAILWDCGADTSTAGLRLIPRTIRAPFPVLPGPGNGNGLG